MAYRPPSWRNRESIRRKDEENVRNFLEYSICTSQFEISCFNIDVDTYNRFTLEEKKEWICEHCMSKFSKWKPQTSRSTYTPERPVLDLPNNSVRRGQRTTSQPKISDPGNLIDDESNLTLVRTQPLKNEDTDVRIQSPKNVDTDKSLLSEIRMLRGELSEINEKISSLSDNMDRKFDEFEKRINAKDEETLILRHSLLEHQNRVNSSVQPIKYFLFLMVLLYLVSFLHSKRN